MSDDEILASFHPLYSDIREADEYYNQKPLLAHYTSLSNLKSILENEEVWLSNPLFMNDFEEVRFGVNEGMKLFLESTEISEAAGSTERHDKLRSSFEHYFDKFANNHVVDVFVFCFSLHDPQDNDGRLSMWRGYGASGNGACLVFDTSKIPRIENSPLIISRVHYASAEERRQWIADRITQFCSILTVSDIPVDKLYLAAYSFLERLKLFALFTKHHGFKEEEEWRMVYLPDRDESSSLKSMIDYTIGSRGVEPKLKLKVTEIPDAIPQGLSLTNIIDRILLGPATSSPLAKAMVEKMLGKLKKEELKNKVTASTIPFRALG
jgi:Protein of unknown function (DUF2971)